MKYLEKNWSNTHSSVKNATQRVKILRPCIMLGR